jgi:hypothetical protein
MISTPTPDSIVVPLQLAGLEQQLSQVIGQILAFLPVVFSAIVILAVGFIVGRLLEAIVVRILDSIGLSDYTGGTALESSGEGSGLERALGKIAAFYVYFVAISPLPTSSRFQFSPSCSSRSARSFPSSSARSSCW